MVAERAPSNDAWCLQPRGCSGHLLGVFAAQFHVSLTQMLRVSPSPEQRESIARRIASFEREAPETHRWLAPFVRQHGALPLYLAWTEAIGITPDGVLVSWPIEGEGLGARPLDEFSWSALALVRGAQRYPELASLIPTRPVASKSCDTCGGTGTVVAGHPELDCVCGNLGWVPLGGVAPGAG